MLLELARWLQGFARLFSLFNYITMRAILGALTALVLTLWLGPAIIGWLAKLKVGGQPIRTDGPQTHFVKAGTPTMGGFLILLTITLSTLLWGDLRNRYVWVVLAVLLGFGLIARSGFARQLKTVVGQTAAVRRAEYFRTLALAPAPCGSGLGRTMHSAGRRPAHPCTHGARRRAGCRRRLRRW